MNVLQPVSVSTRWLSFSAKRIKIVQVAVAIIVSWLIFQNPMSSMNAIGCSITLVGCTFYGYVRHKLALETLKQIEAQDGPDMLPLVSIKPVV